MFRYLLLLLFLPLTVSSQETEKTLLWRISGKGLERPSYLYGTMHLKDKRIFHFGDSMYAAIAHTEGLALELDMNEMVGYYINKYVDQTVFKKKIKDVLDNDDNVKYKERLEKKFGKDYDEITTKDIIDEKNKWLDEYSKKGEMTTFIDAYLCDLAAKQGKWTGGIEDIEDQVSLVDESDIQDALATNNDKSDVLNESAEQMIGYYVNEDLPAINNMFNGHKVLKYRLLTKRNIKMARRMDSLMAFRTMFFAVGAAHLPGDSGVINMLRARGFTVDPVFSKSKIYSKDYKFKEVPALWSEVTDDQHLYTVSMPGIPASLKLFGLVELKFMIRLSNLSGFCTMAAITPDDSLSAEEHFKNVAKKMIGKEKIREPQKIWKEGVQGFEYRDFRDKYYYRINLFRKGNANYVVWFFGNEESDLTSPEAERFFNSLKLNEIKPAVNAKVRFSDSMLGITFKSPALIGPNKEMTDKSNKLPGWDLQFWSGQNKETGSYIFLFYKQVKAGNTLSNDSILLNGFADYYKKDYNSTSKWTNFKGYPAMEIEGDVKNAHTKILSFVRGNKQIAIMVIAQGKGIDANEEEIFRSLQLIPYGHFRWELISDSLKTFCTTGPSPFTAFDRDSTSDDSHTFLYCFDSGSATSYMVYTDTLNKYFWETNDSLFLKKQLSTLISEKDSLIWERMTKNGNDGSIEGLIQKKHSHRFERARVILHGDIAYILYAFSDSEGLTWEYSGKFYDDFLAKSPVARNIHENKMAMLTKDLQSTDSATFRQAYGALSDQELTPNDVQLLMPIAFKEYPSLYPGGDDLAANQLLANKISKVGSAGTVAYIKSQYPKLTGKKESLKNIALGILADLGTKESFSALAKLIKEQPPKEGNHYLFATKMLNKPELLRDIFPDIRGLIADTGVGLVVAWLGGKLLDSGLITIEEVAMCEKALIGLTSKKIPGLKDEISYHFGFKTVLYLLDTLNTKETRQSIREYTTVKNNYLKMRAALYLAKRNEPVHDSIWNELAAGPETRLELYNSLVDINKESFFPVAKLNQKSFSESLIYASATDNEEMEFLSETLVAEDTAEVKGVQYRFFLYKITYGNDSDNASYLGVAGGYSLTDPSNLETEPKYTGVFTNENYDEIKVKELFQVYLKIMDESDK